LEAGPLKVKMSINGRAVKAETEYDGRLRLRVNDLMVDLHFKPSTVEVDLRGFSLDPRNLNLLLHMIKPALALASSSSSSGQRVILKVYGITIRFGRSR